MSLPGPAGPAKLNRVGSDRTLDSFQTLGLSREGRPVQGRFYPGSMPETAPSLRYRLLVFGGIHGDEPATVEAVLEWGAHLADHQHAADVWVVPAVNPDGLAAARKNNAADIDLNRNFPARNFMRSYPPGYDPGPAPLSEPETAVLAGLLEEAAIDAVVAVHAPFACVNFDGPAREWGEAVATASGWPLRADIGYPTPGSLGSWWGGDRSRPILTLELPAGPLDFFRAQALAALNRALDWWNPVGASMNLRGIG
jgi:protein MpaA